MEYAYRFGSPQRLYLNVTNRCTNRCSFCVRNHSSGLGGSLLWGGLEPDLQALQDAVLSRGGPQNFREFVWCGYGEPSYRLELIRSAAGWLRSSGAKLRLNTNGHACLIHQRNVLPDLSDAVDEVSVSLNAPTCKKYLELCRPDPRSFQAGNRSAPSPGEFWQAMLDFLAQAPCYFKRVQASVVGFVLDEEQIEECRKMALFCGVHEFHIR
jgi:TatD DNase family protein